MRNPELGAFSWEARAAEARRIQATLLPNPELSVEIEEAFGDRHALRESEAAVSIGQVILLGGKVTKQERVARYARDVAGWDYEAKRLDVLTDVARAFVDVLAGQEKVALTEGTVHIAEQVAAAAADRVTAGAASPVEETRARIALAAAQTQLDRERQALEAARVRLAATWGSSEPAFSRVDGQLALDLRMPERSALARCLSQNPDLARAAVAVRQSRASVDLEKARRIPDVTVELGVQHFEEDNAEAYTAGLSVPLPFFDRNQGGIREAHANWAKAQWERRAAELRVHAALAEAHASLAAALRQTQRSKIEIMPRAQAAFDAIREGYRLGNFEFVDLLNAQQTLAETRMEHMDGLVDLHRARIDVERLIGMPLPQVADKAEEERQ